MNDEAIKKALECCVEGHCSKCPMLGKYSCSKSLREHALDLINRQQAENEQLQSLCTAKDVIIEEQEAEIERLKWEKDHFEFKVDDLKGKLEKFKEYRDIKNGAYEREIEKLQAEIERLQKYSTEVAFKHYNDGRTEAIKEFAEKLKKEAVTKCDWDNCVDFEDIDRLVAETVGEQNV